MKSLTLLNPETITVLDPACGSGHILVEAYEVLKAIYLERGYRMRDIPRLILEKNLYGLDIDERAAQLAGFALLMKARTDDRRLLDNPPRLNVLALQESKGLDADELTQALSGLLTPSLEFALRTGQDPSKFAPGEFVATLTRPTIASLIDTFAHAKTFGSLIQIPPDLNAQLATMDAALQWAIQSGDLLAQEAALNMLPLVRQARILGMQFDAVVANPPYMGSKGMNPALKDYAKRTFPDSKSDLFAMFIERGFEWCKRSGFNSMVTMQSWMFLSSYQAMREKLLSNKTLNTMAHLGARAFSEISGEVVQTIALVFHVDYLSGYKPAFFRLIDGTEEQKQTALLLGQNRFDSTVQDDFKKISGSPVAYWLSDKVRDIFSHHEEMKEFINAEVGLQTSNNNLFLRQWFEVAIHKIGFGITSSILGKESGKKWFPYNKDGGFRKWWGNQDYVVNWENDGFEIKKFVSKKYPYLNGNIDYVIKDRGWFFKQSVSWSDIASGDTCFRIYPPGFIFDVQGMSAFCNSDVTFGLLGTCNTKFMSWIIKSLNPTLHFQAGNFRGLPYFSEAIEDVTINDIVEIICEIAKTDWNNYEISWDFTENPLIRQKQNTAATISPVIPAGMPESSHRDVKLSAGTSAQSSICANATLPSMALDSGIPAGMTAFSDKAANPTYASTSLEQCFNKWQKQNRAAIAEMQRLEEENNRLFIEAYGLQDELSPEVPEEQITLARADREKDCQRLISYTIGCMMGRYNLDEPGLIYAHAGNIDFDPNRYNTFPADADGIVPITDELWFEDDAANRIREFLLAVWGNPSPQPSPQGEGVEANIAWLAESLGQRGNETPIETIRRYIAGSFFKDHLQTYKKRPIYWLFSSGKQGAFQALVYLHRYHEGTLARMRAEYVVPLTGKIQSRIDMLEKDAAVAASNTTRSKLNKDIEKLRKKHVELLAYDEKLRHYADLRIQLDLDDGVKVNYGKFGDLLAEVKAVTGGTGDD